MNYLQLFSRMIVEVKGVRDWDSGRIWSVAVAWNLDRRAVVEFLAHLVVGASTELNPHMMFRSWDSVPATNSKERNDGRCWDSCASTWTPAFASKKKKKTWMTKSVCKVEEISLGELRDFARKDECLLRQRAEWERRPRKSCRWVQEDASYCGARLPEICGYTPEH